MLGGLGLRRGLVPTPLLAKARRRETVAATKCARELGSLPVADEARDMVHRDRRLLDQQLGGRGHAPRKEILLEGVLTKPRVRTLQLTRRARQRRGHLGERQLAAVVTRDDNPRQQVQPAMRGERLGMHTPSSDPDGAGGH
jgi:hypothetical protein